MLSYTFDIPIGGMIVKLLWTEYNILITMNSFLFNIKMPLNIHAEKETTVIDFYVYQTSEFE